MGNSKLQHLYVMEQGARLIRSGEKVEVWLKDVKLQSVRPDDLDQCVVMGNVGLTTPAVRALLRGGSDVVFLTRTGTFLGRLSNGLSKNVLRRISQYQVLSNEQNRLCLARSFVSGKIENQRRLLLRYQKRHHDERIAAALVKTRHLLAAAGQATNLDELRGFEGKAASIYFGCFPPLLRAPDITFTKRQRRPPPDPVNVLLSFGYTMLGNLMHSLVESAGLDPYLGALHDPVYGRPSLVLDLIEEFRPVVVDSAVLRAINTKAINTKDFERLRDEIAPVEEIWEREKQAEADRTGEEAGNITRNLIFKKAGIKKFVTAINKRLAEHALYTKREQRLSLREIMKAQLFHFASCLKEQTSYSAYLSPI